MSSCNTTENAAKGEFFSASTICHPTQCQSSKKKLGFIMRFPYKVNHNGIFLINSLKTSQKEGYCIKLKI